jgi:hypothetical protein
MFPLTRSLGIGKPAEQLGQRNTQYASHRPKVEDREVALATLDRADKCPVQGATVPELLLRQSVRQPPLADAFAQVAEEFSVVQVHRA